MIAMPFKVNGIRQPTPLTAEAGKISLPAIALTASTTIHGLILFALLRGPMRGGMSYLTILGLVCAGVVADYAFFAELLRQTRT